MKHVAHSFNSFMNILIRNMYELVLLEPLMLVFTPNNTV